MRIVFNKPSVQPCYNDLFAHLSYNDLYDTRVFIVVVMLFFLNLLFQKLDPMRDAYCFQQILGATLL
jgi:hypothetical protein